MTKKYIIKLEYTTNPIEAEDEEDAKNIAMMNIEDTPQQTFSTFVYDNLEAIEC